MKISLKTQATILACLLPVSDSLTAGITEFQKGVIGRYATDRAEKDPEHAVIWWSVGGFFLLWLIIGALRKHGLKSCALMVVFGILALGAIIAGGIVASKLSSDSDTQSMITVVTVVALFLLGAIPWYYFKRARRKNIANQTPQETDDVNHRPK